MKPVVYGLEEGHAAGDGIVEALPTGGRDAADVSGGVGREGGGIVAAGDREALPVVEGPGRRRVTAVDLHHQVVVAAGGYLGDGNAAQRGANLE